MTSQLKLLLVRHSETRVDPDIPADQWRLTEDGRARCGPMAEQLRSHSIRRVVASREPKAVETAELVGRHLGLDVDVIDGLHEQDRTGVPFYDDVATFRARVAKLFEHPDQVVLGNKTANDALNRFVRALDEVVTSYPPEKVSIVTHATVMSLYIASRTKVDGYSYWKRLGMPAFAVLSLPNLRLIETVESMA